MGWKERIREAVGKRREKILGLHQEAKFQVYGGALRGEVSVGSRCRTKGKSGETV